MSAVLARATVLPRTSMAWLSVPDWPQIEVLFPIIFLHLTRYGYPSTGQIDRRVPPFQFETRREVVRASPRLERPSVGGSTEGLSPILKEPRGAKSPLLIIPDQA
jgi:hypothetical protein